MWNRSRARSSALERALDQLSRPRAPGKTDAGKISDFQEYMDALTKKIGTFQSRQPTVENFSVISSDESEAKPQDDVMVRNVKDEPSVGVGSRFLKKAPPRDSLSPALGTVDAGRSASTWECRSQSKALSRLTLIEERIKKRTQAASGSTVAPWASADTTVMSPQSSSDLNPPGPHFLKKRPTVAMSQRDAKITSSGRYSPPQIGFSVVTVSLESDEEDMRKLLGGSPHSEDSLLEKSRSASQKGIEPPGKVGSVSPFTIKKTFIKSTPTFQPSLPPSSNNRSPSLSDPSLELRWQSPPSSVQSASVASSPSSPKSRSPERVASGRILFSRTSVSAASVHSDVRSLDELFVEDPHSNKSLSERSTASDEFRINVLSLDDLVPDVGKAERDGDGKLRVIPEASRAAKLPSCDLRVMDAWEAEHQEESQPAEDYESDFENEISTESEEVHETSQASAVSQGEDSVSERLQENRFSHSERDGSLQGSGSESLQSESHRSSKSSSPSSSATVTPLQNKGVPSEGRAVKEATTQTPTDGLYYFWATEDIGALGPSVGMPYADPTPVTRHVISAEALEALSAYSPAMLALNDILKQQLALVRRSVETSRHLHALTVRSLEAVDYHYTTLEETREFIKQHKTPKLTMEEALEEVLQEMKDYHYL